MATDIQSPSFEIWPKMENFVRSDLSDEELIECAKNNGINKYFFFVDPVQPQTKIPQVTPFKLKNELDRKVPTKKIQDLRFTRKGALIISSEDYETAICVSQIDELLGVKTKAKLMTEQLISRFILKPVPSNVNLAELKEELENVNEINILELKRFTQRNPSRSPTETILVTVLGHELPQEIKMCYQNFPIEEFVDRPRQCKNCFKFGHPEKFCRNATKCVNCGDSPQSEGHEDGKCTNEVKCANCKEMHLPYDRSCDAFQEEIRFLKFKTENHLPIAEARRLFTQNKKKAVFSKVVSKEPKTITKKELKSEMQELALNIEKEIMPKVNEKIEASFKETIKIFQKAIELAKPEIENNVVSAVSESLKGLIQNTIREEMQKMQTFHSDERNASPGRKRRNKEKNIYSKPEPANGNNILNADLHKEKKMDTN